MKGQTEPALDLIWGVESIAKIIGRTPRQTFHMLKCGVLPGQKVGERWVVERKKLIEFFTGEAA